MPLLQGMSERSRRRCHGRARAKVLTDLSQEWLGKVLELVLSDARDLREFAFSLWRCPRHLEQCCIGKTDVTGTIARVRDFSPQAAATVERFFVQLALTRR